MIGVLTFLRARPGRVDELADTLQAIIGPSLLNPGCVAMHLYADHQDGARLMLYEQWVSKTDFDVNGALPQFQWFWQHRMELLQEDVEFQFFNLLSPEQSAIRAAE